MAEFPPILILDCSEEAGSICAFSTVDSDSVDCGSIAEALSQLKDHQRSIVIACGVSAESAVAADIHFAWQGEVQSVWFAEDICSVLGTRPREEYEDAPEWWADASRRLSQFDDTRLAQSVHLASEAGETGRLGFLEAELMRRFDVFNTPAPGEVNIEQYFPPDRDAAHPPRQEIPTDILELVFDAREKLTEVFTSYEDRPQQIDMANQVELALKESRPLVIEAGTGVGKSLAYLLPLAVHSAQTGKLCLVSTNTLNLQQQLIDLDVPRLRMLLDNLDLKITLLKGREHYLCIKRLEDTWLRNNSGAQQRRERYLNRGFSAVAFVIKLLLNLDPKTGDLDSVSGIPELSQLDRTAIMRSVDCSFFTCIGDRCEYRRKCHFFSMRAEAISSHIVITNHALVFALHSPDNSDSDSIVSRSSAIVFDEAHNLESVITDQYTLEFTNESAIDIGNRLMGVLQDPVCSRRLELSPSSLADTLKEDFESLLQRNSEIHELIRKAAEIKLQVNRLLEQASEKGHLQTFGSNQLAPATASPGQRQVMELLEKLAQRFLPLLGRFSEITSLLNHLFCQEEGDLYIDEPPWQMELQALTLDLLVASRALSNWHPEEESSICWFNTDISGPEPQWDYRTAPLDVGPLFQSLSLGRDCVILSSATLSVANSFEYLQTRLGFQPEDIGRTQWLKLDSPFDYSSQSLLLIADDMDTPTGSTRDTYLDQLEEVVAGVCNLFEKGVLVLFNSYRDLDHIADAMVIRGNGDRILAQGRSGSRAEIADEFRRTGNRVLLATRSFWEGFDVSGEALSCVVLAKLPFANFRDPIHAGRQRAIEAEGGDSFRNYSLPLAAMQLKQGFGRLIRSGTDRGCVFLLDSRVARASYGQVFLDSLPGPSTFTGNYQDCLEKAADFMGAVNA